MTMTEQKTTEQPPSLAYAVVSIIFIGIVIWYLCHLCNLIFSHPEIEQRVDAAMQQRGLFTDQFDYSVKYNNARGTVVTVETNSKFESQGLPKTYYLYIFTKQQGYDDLYVDDYSWWHQLSPFDSDEIDKQAKYARVID